MHTPAAVDFTAVAASTATEDMEDPVVASMADIQEAAMEVEDPTPARMEDMAVRALLLQDIHGLGRATAPGTLLPGGISLIPVTPAMSVAPQLRPPGPGPRWEFGLSPAQ